MKKTLLILSLFVLTISVKAQYSRTDIDYLILLNWTPKTHADSVFVRDTMRVSATFSPIKANGTKQYPVTLYFNIPRNVGRQWIFIAQNKVDLYIKKLK